MTRQTQILSLSALLGIGGALLTLPAFADEVVTVSLTPSPNGGQAAMSPRKIELSDKKSDGITKEPLYRNTPRYGTITLGDAKANKIVVVLDAPSRQRGSAPFCGQQWQRRFDR